MVEGEFCALGRFFRHYGRDPEIQYEFSIIGASEMREVITFVCTECKRKNYTSNKNKMNTKERLELPKFCNWCRKHTKHKEEK